MIKRELMCYLTIKDEFNVIKTGSFAGQFAFGSGEMETISDSEYSNFDIESFYNAIKEDVAAWVENTGYASVSDAIEHGVVATDLYAVYCDNSNWDSYVPS